MGRAKTFQCKYEAVDENREKLLEKIIEHAHEAHGLEPSELSREEILKRLKTISHEGE